MVGLQLEISNLVFFYELLTRCFRRTRSAKLVCSWGSPVTCPQMVSCPFVTCTRHPGTCSYDIPVDVCMDKISFEVQNSD